MQSHKHFKNEGFIAMDYYAYQSSMRLLHPAYKIILGIAVLVICLMFNKIAVSVFVLFTMAPATILFGKLHVRKYLSVFLIPGVFAWISGIAIAVEISFHGGFHIIISVDNVIRAGNILLRAFACISCVYFFSLTTPVSEVIGTLEKMRCPKILVELMHMIYRFIFILLQVQSRMSTAAMSRQGYVDFRTSYRTFGKIGANLFIVAFRKADIYYSALLSRCYQGEFSFMEEKRSLHWKHCVAAGCYLVMLLLVGAV